MKNKEQNRFWTNKVAKFSVCDALKLFPKTLLISAPFYQNPVPPFDRLSRPFRELSRPFYSLHSQDPLRKLWIRWHRRTEKFFGRISELVLVQNFRSD